VRGHLQPAHTLGIEYHAANDLNALRCADVGDESRGCFLQAGRGFRGGCEGGRREGDVEGSEGVLVAFPAEEDGIVVHAFHSWRFTNELAGTI